jgi:hypothetical protein
MNINKKDYEDKFDNFLMVMDAQLEALSEQATKRNITFDYTLSDLERLEELFALMTKSADKEMVNDLIVTFARHLGEVVRLNIGGKWHLPLDDKKNVNYNTPVIIGHSIKGLEFAPISVMRSFALRRKPGTLRRAVEAQIDIKPLDLSDLVEGK